MASRTRRFFLNAISLTSAALIMRAVSVLFNVYISNAAGSEAMGLFSLLGSIYGFSMTVAMAGINLGVTRLVSDALATGDRKGAKRSAAVSIAVCAITGTIAGLLLFSLSGVLGEHVLGDVRAIRPLKLLALTLVPVAISSCLSGYFTAVRRVKVNAAFGIVSQFVKIGATIVLLSFFVDLGTEQACLALVAGGAVAEFFSLGITFLLYLVDKKKYLKTTSQKPVEGGITKKLLSITLPVTFSACIRSALSMFQHILIPKGIHKSGKSWSAALSSYGALHGMALPLLLFPSAFITSFAGLLIPEISECCAQNDVERLKRTSYRTLSLSLFFSIGVSGIMLFFSHELGLAVYQNEETALYIRVLAPLIPVMYIDSAVDAILKGSGHQVYSMNINIIDTLTACIFALTLIPKMGIWGYVISIYATEIMNTTLSLIKMMSVSGMRPRPFMQVGLPVLCIIGATNLSRLFFGLLPTIVNSAVTLTAQIILSSLLYIGLLAVTKTVTKEEKEFLSASLLSEESYNRKYRTLSESANKPTP
ncbi:MAG: MATE family efflux transporter [Eubacteriales bacterium]